MTSLTENSADNLEVNPEGVTDDDSHLKRQLKAGERILTQVRQEKNNLQDAKVQLHVELKDVRAQLADSVKENKRLRCGIYGKYPDKLYYSSTRKYIERILLVGMLTGRPKEEMPSSAGEVLQELSQLHERARRVMLGVAQALWPSSFLPNGMGELVDLLQGARRRFRLWKMSARRQGAREAWAMVKTRYTRLDPNHMARVGPAGPDGQEIPVSLVYD